MDVSHVPAGSIVVGIDGSPWSDGALEWAVDQAALEARSLTVLHAMPALGAQSVGLYASSGVDFERLVDDSRGAAHKVLADATAVAHARRPGVEVQCVLSLLDPRNALLDLGERAAMVVVGSRGRGSVASLVLGSVSVSVSTNASCPVVVIRAGEPARTSRGIAVGVDGTQDSVPALEFAFRLASFRQCDLTVLHCYRVAPPLTVPTTTPLPPDLSSDSALVSESLAGMAEKFPEVALSVELVPGSAQERLAASSTEHDLVVVGHRRVGHLSALVHDSDAPAVLEHAEGSVAVVPSVASTSAADERPLPHG